MDGPGLVGGAQDRCPLRSEEVIIMSDPAFPALKWPWRRRSVSDRARMDGKFTS